MQSEISHPRNFAHHERWFACSRPLLEAKSYGFKVKSKTVRIITKHILKRKQGRIGINRFQSTGGNDNAARIRSKRRFRNLCKMPDKEYAALVLPRAQFPYVSTPKTLCLHLRDLLQRKLHQSSTTGKKINKSEFIFCLLLSHLHFTFFTAQIHLSCALPSAAFSFLLPYRLLTRFVLPTSFFTSSLASSIAIRSRRSSAISSCSVGRWSLYLAAKMRLLCKGNV